MSVLQRKAQVGKDEHQARAMTVPKSLRVGLAKVADDAFDMALAVIGVTQERCSAEDLPKKIDEDSLLILLDGPVGVTGGAIVGAALVNALVQQQTMGRVLPPSSAVRSLTETDAALCAPVLDALFVRANGLLETPQDKQVLPAFKFGARAENQRLFSLALEDPEYTVLKLTIDVSGGIAQSTLTLVLPLPKAVPERQVSEGEPTTPASPATLEKSVMGVTAELSAVLCRVRVSLSEMSRLRPGDTLSIPANAFESVEVLSIDGARIARGAMGQLDGKRALMLGQVAASHQSAGLDEESYDDLDGEASDYGNLNLPELELPQKEALFEPTDAGLMPDLPDLPDLPDIEGLDDIGLPDLPDLPDLDGELPDIGELPKLNIA